MKRVQDLIVGTTYDTTITMANFATKAAGAINIIDPATGISWATGGESAMVVRVCQDSDSRFYIRQSLIMGSGLIKNHDAKEYAAATPKIMTLTLTALPANASLGDIHELWITDYNDSNYIVPRRRIEFVATATLETPTQVAAGLAAAILADVSLPNVTATSAGDVLTITGAAVDGSNNVIVGFRAAHEVLFNLGLGEGLGLGVAATTQVADKGCGSYREILKLEEIYKGYRGFTNRVWNSGNVSNIQYDSVSTDNYDVNSIMHSQPQHTNNEGNVNPQVSTVIALEQSVAVLPGAGGTFHADLRTMTDELK
jgi:hypothetical protein